MLVLRTWYGAESSRPPCIMVIRVTVKYVDARLWIIRWENVASWTWYKTDEFQQIEGRKQSMYIYMYINICIHVCIYIYFFYFLLGSCIFLPYLGHYLWLCLIMVGSLSQALPQTVDLTDGIGCGKYKYICAEIRKHEPEPNFSYTLKKKNSPKGCAKVTCIGKSISLPVCLSSINTNK